MQQASKAVKLDDSILAIYSLFKFKNKNLFNFWLAL